MENKTEIFRPALELLNTDDGFYRTIVFHCQRGKTRSAAFDEQTTFLRWVSVCWHCSGKGCGEQEQS